MSSAIVLTVFPLFLQGVRATVFPETREFRPIPSAAVRSADIPPQEYYIQDEILSNPPRTVIKEEAPYSPDFKPDNERWYISENQSGGTGDFPTSAESFSRFYPNGEPAIGPVATPIPDDNYVAQQSNLAKVVPNAAPNAGSSDIWLLRNGPNDQLVPERWVKVQVPTDRVVEVVNQDPSPKIITNTVKSIPPPPSVKSLPPPPPPPAPGSSVQQIWFRAPNVANSQKIYQSTGSVVQEVPSIKQIIDVPPPNLKQVVQVQSTKDLFPQSSPPTSIISKTVVPSSFSLPPPPPPPIPAKSIDITGSKQIIAPPAPVSVVQNGDDIYVGKNPAVQQVRHIWIPTSPQTGKFVSVPVSDSIDKGKSVTEKGTAVDVVPISVSDTWVLKQDGPVPRFEPQKPVIQSQVVQGGKVIIDETPVIQSQVVQGGKVVIDETPVIQIDSPKNPPLLEKSINPAPRPLDIWPVRKDIPSAKMVGKADFPPSSLPVPLPKSDAIIVDKTLPTPVVSQKSLPPKTYRFTGKILSPLPPPPPPPLPKVAPVSKVKLPCPIPSQKFAFPSRNIAVSALSPPTAIVKRQPLTRIVRVNRYPYGSYYVLNSRVRPSLYTYPSPRVIATNSLVRLVTKPVAVPIQTRPIVVPVSSQKVPLIYPNVQPVNRIRYVYPWGSYLRAIPTPGKSVFSLTPSIPARIEAAGSSSESSSSESSSSESASVPSKQASKKSKTPAPAVSSESASSEEKETEEPKAEEPAAEAEPSAELEAEAESVAEPTEPEKASEEGTTAESEAQESIETAESQLALQIQNLPEANEDPKPTAKPYLFEFNQRDKAGTIQHRKEISNAEGTVTGSYGFKNSNGTYRTVFYIADKAGYRVLVNSNEPNTVSHKSADANFVSNQQSGNMANAAKLSESAETSTKENKLVESFRD